jgi:hypothetical protein
MKYGIHTKAHDELAALTTDHAELQNILNVAHGSITQLAAELADHKANARSADALEEQFERKNARIAALEAALRKVVMEGKIYAAHHSLERLAQAMYDIAEAALIPAKTPVSTLCAVCDQIKELHPNTHPWTAKTTAETTAYRSAREMPDGGYVYAESREAADAKVTAAETSVVGPVKNAPLLPCDHCKGEEISQVSSEFECARCHARSTVKTKGDDNAKG